MANGPLAHDHKYVQCMYVLYIHTRENRHLEFAQPCISPVGVSCRVGKTRADNNKRKGEKEEASSGFRIILTPLFPFTLSLRPRLRYEHNRTYFTKDKCKWAEQKDPTLIKGP